MLRKSLLSVCACAGFLMLYGAMNASTKEADTLAANQPTESVASTETSDKLIVHEWGTFTSFSGSDGVKLEYRPLLDEDLPAFVLDRFLQSGTPTFTKARIRSQMRMETPVTYFYTDRERDVNVKVGFPEGLLTEFYPPVAKMAPAYKLGEKPTIKNSMLDWGKVHLIPTDRLVANVKDAEYKKLLESRMLHGLIPPEQQQHNHYFHARETDSALVHVHLDKTQWDPKDPNSRFSFLRPTGDFFEKFLFYRGVGNFDLPLNLTSHGSGQFELHNSGTDRIGTMFLVKVDGKTIHFSVYDGIDGNSKLALSQSTEKSNINELSVAVVEALEAEGLYKKEALSMVNTWKKSWFGEQGTRLFYMVPTRLTDEILPLDVSPKPDETIRVLVGRMEIMTKEDEQKMIELVRTSVKKRKDIIAAAKKANKKPKYVLPQELTRWGRLAEPALVRVRATTDDAQVRSEAKYLLSRLNPEG